jgi:hypothetical protein
MMMEVPVEGCQARQGLRFVDDGRARLAETVAA